MKRQELAVVRLTPMNNAAAFSKIDASFTLDRCCIAGIAGKREAKVNRKFFELSEKRVKVSGLVRFLTSTRGMFSSSEISESLEKENASSKLEERKM